MELDGSDLTTKYTCRTEGNGVGPNITADVEIEIECKYVIAVNATRTPPDFIHTIQFHQKLLWFPAQTFKSKSTDFRTKLNAVAKEDRICRTLGPEMVHRRTFLLESFYNWDQCLEVIPVYILAMPGISMARLLQLSMLTYFVSILLLSVICQVAYWTCD